MLISVYLLLPPYPFLYLKKDVSRIFTEHSQPFVDLTFFKPLSQTPSVFAISSRPQSDYNWTLLSRANSFIVVAVFIVFIPGSQFVQVRAFTSLGSGGQLILASSPTENDGGTRIL